MIGGGRANAASAALVAMYRPSSDRSNLPSSSRSKESSASASRSSRSGASASGSTRGRSPRRSRSPSPPGRRRHRSPSSSRSSRRSPSPRRSSRARSPSGGSRSRRGSEQRDGSLSRRFSPRRHTDSSQRHPQFLDNYSPSRHCESSVEEHLWTESNNDFYGIDPREQRRLSDRLGSPDSPSDVDRGYLDDDSVFVRGYSRSRSLERYRIHQESPPSSFSTRYDKDYRGRDAFIHQSDYNMNDDHLEDLPRESDRDGKLFTKSLRPSEEERLNPKRPRYDREDRLLDVSTDLQSSLSEKQNYYKQRLSSSQMYTDEDFRKLVSSRRNREEEELSKNTCQDFPGSDYEIHGLTNCLQSSESQYPYRPDESRAMPKKSILKKRVDDPTMQPCEQNFENFLRKKEYQESTSDPGDLREDFLLPHERACLDGRGTSYSLDRIAESGSTQEERKHSLLDVEDAEKFLYGDDEGDSNVNCPSTEELTMNGGKESVSLNKRPPSPIPSEGSGIEYEKIHDLLKTIGLDIGVAEIGKGAARTQERLHGKTTLRSPDGLSHKVDVSEEDSIQSHTHPSESNQKNSSSPCGSSQPSNDISSALVLEHAKSKTLEYTNSAGPPEQSFPSVSVTPSAPPLLPNLPPPPPPISLSHFSAFLAAQGLQNYPPPIMAPPTYNAYGHCSAYSAKAWPMYPPPPLPNPPLPNVHGLASVTVPPHPTRSNLRVIKTVSTINPEKKNPEKIEKKKEKRNPEKRNESVLVEVPITPTDSKLRSQSSISGTTGRIADGKNPPFQKPQEFKLGERISISEECNKGHGVTVHSGNNTNKTTLGVLLLSNLLSGQPQRGKIDLMLHMKEAGAESQEFLKRQMEEHLKKYHKDQVIDKREKLKADKETSQKKLQYLETELARVSRQKELMLLNKRKKNCTDPLLTEIKKTRGNVASQVNNLKFKIEAAERKLSKLDKESLNKNPLDEERKNLGHETGLNPVQETKGGPKQKQCKKQKKAKDEKSAKVAREEKSEITKELEEEGDGNEISERKEDSHGQKRMISLVLKKGNIQVEKEEGERGESQMESNQLSSEKGSLKKTETNNQSQDQDVAAPKVKSTEEGKCRENKSGNPDSKQKVAAAKAQNLGMRTKNQKRARIAKVQQQFQSFNSPHCHPLVTLPPGPPPSLFPYPGSGLSYNMCIPPFSDSLLFTLQKATEEQKRNNW